MDNLVLLFQSHLKDEFSFLVLALCFLGGLVASLSPCGLGMLPVVISYIGSSSEKRTSKNTLQLIFFILGLAACLTAIGIACALTGQIFDASKRVYFIIVLTSLLMIFGLNLIGVIDINFPVIIKQFPQSEKHNFITYPFLLGMVFALASSPCSTPILAGIMAAASISANIFYAALMLFLFSIGQGMIILIAGLFTSVLKNLTSMAKYTDILTKLSGVILILFSLFLFYKVFSGVI